jgi:hypothetical protein
MKSPTKDYNMLRRIIITIINETKSIDPLDILFDWLLSSGNLFKLCKPALKDLTSLVVFFNNSDDNSLPYFDHKLSPERTLTRDEESFNPPLKTQDYIYDKKFKQAREGKSTRRGYYKKIIKYHQIDDDWWDEKDNLWKCLDDLFEFEKTKDVDFDKIFRERYRKIGKIIPLTSKPIPTSKPESIIIPDEDVSLNEEEQKSKPLEPDVVLLEEEFETQELYETIEDKPSELDVSLPEEEMIVTSFIDILGNCPIGTVDPLKWLKEELDYTVLKSNGSDDDILSRMYELNDQVRQSINDDSFSNDILTAAVWMMGDEIRNEMHTSHNLRANDYTEYQQAKFKGLKDRLVGGDNKFWTLTWSNSIISLKMSL